MIKHHLLSKLRFVVGLMLFLLTVNSAKAQLCTGCTTVITASSAANFTVGPADVVCVNPGVNLSGNITLNGGILCNQGMIANLTLIQGTFRNHGSFSKPSGNLTISNAKNLKIECFSNSGFDVANAVNIDALTNNDSVVINVYGGSKFYIGKSLSMSKGWLKITNAIPDPVTKATSSAFNIGGQLDISNSALKILNLPNGLFNITKAINLDGKYNKIVNNYGIFNSNNSLNISGNGQNIYAVTINNYGSFNVTGNLSSSYNNGTVTVNNFDYPTKPQPTFVVKKSITFSKDNNIFNNYRPLDIGADLTFEKGTFVNYGVVTVRDIEVKNATLTNNNQIYASRDFNLSNANAIVNNNSFIDVSRDFNNSGNFNGGLASYLRTNNYYNNNTGTINGPSSIANDDQYARVAISGHSENSGYINGKVLVHDQTLVGTANNNGYGFDQVSNTSRISSNTAFAAKSAGPSLPIITLCSLLQSIYSVQANASPLTTCSGGTVALISQFYQKVTFTLFFWPSGTITFTLNIPLGIPSSSYTWTPGPLTGQNQTVTPAVTTTYTVAVNYLSCIFTKTVTVTVLPSFAASISANNTPICFPSSPALLLTSTLTPVPSGPTYQWYLNGVAVGVGGTSASINPSAAGTYYLKVTSASGCTVTSNTITVNPTPTVNISSNMPGICGSTPVLLSSTVAAGSGSGFNYQWTQNSSNVGSNTSTHSTNSPGSYQLIVTNSAGCSAPSNVVVLNTSGAITFNPPFIQYTLPSLPFVIGSTPIASGGTTPYSYAWIPSGSYNQTVQNPTVNPGITSTTVYTLTITDANGCTATQDFTVSVVNSNSYAKFKKILDAGYYQVQSGKLYFTLPEEYKDLAQLKYTIYDDYRVIRLIHTGSGAPTLPVTLGDNRYFINLSSNGFSTGDNTKYFSIELRNEKNELALLKFKYEQ